MQERTVNGTGGDLKGYELAGSAPLSLISSWLDGFGTSASYSYTTSSVKLPNIIGLIPTADVPTNLGNIPLPGLSKQNAKLQLYFEKAGFSIFVANNFRSKYVASVAGNAVGGFPVLTWIHRQNWISAQAGYEVQEGYFKGLGFRVEGNNLNSPVYREFGAAGAETLFAKTGRQINMSLSYKM